MPRISPLVWGALLTLGAASLASAQRTRGRDDTTFVWSGRVSGTRLLTVKNIVGDITVNESSGDRVEVRATKRTRGRDPADVTFDVIEGESGTTICTVLRGASACDRGSWNNVRISVQYVIAMPRGLRLRASTGNGAVSIERAGSDVDVSTGNGAIHIGQTEGRVTASTGNGDLEIESAQGPVHATTGNGHVYVSTAAGPVSAETGNGEIDVRMKSLSTDADMDFRSGSGAIRVTLPRDFNGEFEASTSNGELRSDFDIKILGRLDPQHIRGVIGSGGRLIRLITGNGRLELRKGG